MASDIPSEQFRTTEDRRRTFQTVLNNPTLPGSQQAGMLFRILAEEVFMRENGSSQINAGSEVLKALDTVRQSIEGQRAMTMGERFDRVDNMISGFEARINNRLDVSVARLGEEIAEIGEPAPPIIKTIKVREGRGDAFVWGLALGAIGALVAASYYQWVPVWPL